MPALKLKKTVAKKCTNTVGSGPDVPSPAEIEKWHQPKAAAATARTLQRIGFSSTGCYCKPVLQSLIHLVARKPVEGKFSIRELRQLLGCKRRDD